MNKTGNLNEEGIINDFFRRGFTKRHCFGELISNSIDANAKNIKFITKEEDEVKTLYVIDDGKGMGELQIKDMFSLAKENHLGDESMGTSGLGGKIATFLLSDQKKVEIFTKEEDNIKGYYIEVPWNNIIISKKYTGMIDYQKMKKRNTDEFNDIMLENKIKTLHGTIIKFEISDDTYNELKNYLYPNSINQATDKVSNIAQIIFGQFDTNIFFRYTDKDFKDNRNKNKRATGEYTQENRMEKYDYFSNKYNFITKVDKINIYLGKDSKNNYLFYGKIDEDNYLILEKKGNGIARDAKKVNKSEFDTYIKTENIKQTNYFFTIKTGMQDNPKFFDKKEKKIINTTDFKDFTPCDQIIHRKKGFPNVFQQTLIRRNGQVITGLNIEGSKSLRGNSDSCLKFGYIRQEITYKSDSKQDNILDKIIGIQSNRGQHSEEINKYILRLLKKIREIKFQEIKNFAKDFYGIQTISKKEIKNKELKEFRKLLKKYFKKIGSEITDENFEDSDGYLIYENMKELDI